MYPFSLICISPCLILPQKLSDSKYGLKNKFIYFFKEKFHIMEILQHSIYLK